MNLAELRRRMDAGLNEEEVRNLAFDLGIDYENLGRNGKAAIVRELLAALGRMGRLDELHAELKKLHPEFPWDQPLDNGVGNLEPISNLPHPTRTLLGRDEAIRQLSENLEQKLSPIILEGPPGTGKSSLATYVAHRFREKRAFRAFIWWSAEYESRSLGALLDHIGRHLGHRIDKAGPAYESPEAAYQLLRQQPTLLVVNRVTKSQHEELLTFLRDIPSGSCAIVTTTSALAFGQHIRLDALPLQAALALIRTRAEELQFEAIQRYSDAQLTPLVEATAGLPDAIILAVGLAKEKRLPLDQIIETIQAGMGPFSGLCANAYATLSPEAQQALNLICVSKRSIEGPAIEAIVGLEKRALQESVLTPLQDTGLIHNDWGSTWAETRFRAANRIVREYYNAAIRIRDPEADRILRAHLADYYLRHCEARGKEQWHGYHWLESNIQELFGILDWYEVTEQRRDLIRMMKVIYYFLGTRGYWREALRYGDRAGQAARTERDRQSEAEMLVRVIGWTEIQLNMLEKAVEDIERGLKIFEEVESPSGLASATRYLGTIQRRQGNLKAAHALYEQAVSYAERAGKERERLLAGILVSQSTLDSLNRDPRASKDKLQQALGLFEQLGHKPRIGEILSRLADLEYRADNLEEAESLFKASETLADVLDRPLTRGYNMLGLARIEESRGNNAAARTYAEQARQIFGNLGIPNEMGELDDLLRISTDNQ